MDVRQEGGGRRGVRLPRYWLLAALLVAFFLVTFGVVEALHVPVLTDPSAYMDRAGALAAAVGVGLLVGDLVLPVPSSLVMVAHGALFGVVLGAVLSLAGLVGGAAVGFAVGRGGGRLVDRLVPEHERRRADAMLDRWGPLAIVLSRPVPVLAETVTVLAGTSGLGWTRMLLAAFLGSLPLALVYAMTGALVATFWHVATVFVLVLAVAAGLAMAARPRGRAAGEVRGPGG